MCDFAIFFFFCCRFVCLFVTLSFVVVKTVRLAHKLAPLPPFSERVSLQTDVLNLLVKK